MSKLKTPLAVRAHSAVEEIHLEAAKVSQASKDSQNSLEMLRDSKGVEVRHLETSLMNLKRCLARNKVVDGDKPRRKVKTLLSIWRLSSWMLLMGLKKL